MKRKLTPQEKKVFSYARDRRNMYGEARQAAHKQIAKRKHKARRALRRADSITSAEAKRLNPEDVDGFVARGGRKSWVKSPDAPLAQYVAQRLEYRKDRGMNETAKASALLEQGCRKAVPR